MKKTETTLIYRKNYLMHAIAIAVIVFLALRKHEWHFSKVNWYRQPISKAFDDLAMAFLFIIGGLTLAGGIYLWRGRATPILKLNKIGFEYHDIPTEKQHYYWGQVRTILVDYSWCPCDMGLSLSLANGASVYIPFRKIKMPAKKVILAMRAYHKIMITKKAESYLNRNLIRKFLGHPWTCRHYGV